MSRFSSAAQTRRVLCAGLIMVSSGALACAGENAARDTVVTTDSGDVAAPRAPNTESQAVLDKHAALGAKPIATLTPAEARKGPTPADAVKALLTDRGESVAPEAGVTTVDRMIAGAAGRIPARIYTPEGDGPFPVIVYYHGGGWVIANKDVYDAGARALSKGANAVVVSVDYRQGPEHKFPAAHDDAIAAYKWAVANARSINGDTAHIALAGESAGGGLAVATAIAARDQSLAMPDAVIAVYPIAGGDTATASYVEQANAKPLDRAGMNWFFDHYLKSPAERQDPRINLVAADLRNLPPVTIINAQFDPLRSEGELLATRLREAGVPVEQKTWSGVTHEFFGMGAVLDEAREAQEFATDRLKAAWN